MVLGVFAFFHLEVDASFLAAILTVLGYSMNESVVIFDRIREAIHTHRRTDSFAILANDSIHQTIRRSMYTLITTLFCVTSLYLLVEILQRTLLWSCLSDLFQALILLSA